jgi:hypothetical protein
MKSWRREMRLVLIAAIVTLATTAVHVVLGGPEVRDPLLASNAPDIAKAVGSVVWHAVTAVLAINGAALLAAAFKPALRQVIAGLVSAQFLAFAVLFVVYGISRFGSVWPMPQWTVFLIIPALLVPVWVKDSHVARDHG